MKTLSPQMTNRAITLIEVLLVLLVITIVVAMNLNFIIQQQSLIAARLSVP
jgi:competence protein ComGC